MLAFGGILTTLAAHMLRFSLFGFPVTVHWMFWVTTALLGGGLSATVPRDFQIALIWVVAAFISVIVHELGHALLMRLYGGRPEILLYGFGGLASSQNVRWTRWQDIQVSLAGPAFGALLGVAVWALAHLSRHDPWYVQIFMWDMILIAKVWTIVNLLPVIPLDGGRVLLAALAPRQRAAVLVSLCTAAAVAVYFLLRGSTYNGIFFGLLAVRNFQSLQKNPAPYWPGLG